MANDAQRETTPNWGEIRGELVPVEGIEPTPELPRTGF
jgi:hypothetical protein